MARLPRRPLLAVPTLGLWPTPAHAQPGFPSRPVRVIIPFGPGGGTDNLIRAIEPVVSRLLGRPLVVENRPGGGGMIGTELVARAEPDGYTLLANEQTFVINPSLFPNLPYDTLRDFAPVQILANAPIVLIVSAGFPAQTLPELIALVRSRPGAFSYASGGNGSTVHLAAEMLKLSAGLEITHLPYRGSGPAMNDIVAGHVPMGMNGLSAAGPHIRDGRVRALAVTGPTRSAAFPDIPTFQELGVSVEIYTHWGVATRAGTPAPIIARLAEAFGAAVRAPELAERLAAMGYVPNGQGPEAYGRVIAEELERFGRVIRAANIRPD